MKRSIWLTSLLLPGLIHAQSLDSSRLHPALVTTAPLLGGVNVTSLITPITASGHTFTADQSVVDFSTPLYKRFRRAHPVIFKAGFRYQGMFLSGEQNIGSSAFHSLAVPLSYTYVCSRTTNITFIAIGAVGSDFRRNPDASDIMYTAGIRIGFNQNHAFKYGVTLAYVNDYTGSYLIPVPDFDWTISKRWSFVAVLPLRASLKYKLSHGQFLGLTAGLSSGMYRLNADPERKYLQWQQYSSGFLYEVNFSRRWALNLIVARAFDQRLETFDDDQKASLYNFKAVSNRKRLVSYRENSFMAQGGISFKF